MKVPIGDDAGLPPEVPPLFVVPAPDGVPPPPPPHPPGPPAVFDGQPPPPPPPGAPTLNPPGPVILVSSPLFPRMESPNTPAPPRTDSNGVSCSTK